MNAKTGKVSIKEKIGYGLGDAAANIGWRGVGTFLIIFYTDVVGLNPVTVGILLLTARFSDGISDIVMGIIGDRTNSKYGKFRPWILWTAIPLGISLALLFTSPEMGESGKIIYAYITYIAFTLIYTANNIPYGALMAVLSGDHKERTSIGSFRMIGSFGGGILVQGALLFLVAYFGNVGPKVEVSKLGEQTYKVDILATRDVENVNVKTEDGIATFTWNDERSSTDTPTVGKTFSMASNETYSFLVNGEENLSASDFRIINQQKGYTYSFYLMAVILILLMFVTFATTKERIKPPKAQKSNIIQDIKDLLSNRAWFTLLISALFSSTYNALKQGIIIIYFTHYLHNQLLAASYLVGLMLVSIVGAIIMTPLSIRFGKRNLFIASLLVSGAFISLIVFCGPGAVVAIFVLGLLSELIGAMFSTLTFVMLGDAADYSEWKNNRRATGLVYSAGSFSTKFGGGIAGAIIGVVLGKYGYNGLDPIAIQGAIPGIKMLMSWIPAIVAFMGALLMMFYPLSKKMMNKISADLAERRRLEKSVATN
ncbi:MFS transporter [Maribacter polysaccharolyticus]|uniref:MFS transporter n=1 Tax=Maribacter polysaccharolyticus TaxID=3020831 RepID=UPI00237F0DE7|nr:MFS transporter [Maribacter polysaccharolyticus]MDE3744159.1 MFS transporter [Maribacter polysaccharolyticus]